MTDRFDQGRKDVATESQSLICEILAGHCDVASERVTSVESVKSGRYETDDGLDIIHRLDYAGLDWLVDRGTHTIGVAERIRPASDTHDVDFSFRVDNGVSQPCECEIIPEAIKRGGLFPRLYLFAVQDAPDKLRDINIIDTQAFIAYRRGDDVDARTHRTGDGTAAEYHDPQALREAGVVINSWPRYPIVMSDDKRSPPATFAVRTRDTSDEYAEARIKNTDSMEYLMQILAKEADRDEPRQQRIAWCNQRRKEIEA
jgi:hypothetical protein